MFGWLVGALSTLGMRGFDRVEMSPDIEKSSVENSGLREGGKPEAGEAILEV